MRLINWIKSFFFKSIVVGHVRNTAHSIPEKSRKPIGLSGTKYSWTVSFNIGDYKVDFCRQIRGSLIEIFLGDEIIASWVDQTEQTSLLGAGDFEYKKEHLKRIYEIIKN